MKKFLLVWLLVWFPLGFAQVQAEDVFTLLEINSEYGNIYNEFWQHKLSLQIDEITLPQFTRRIDSLTQRFNTRSEEFDQAHERIGTQVQNILDQGLQISAQDSAGNKIRSYTGRIKRQLSLDLLVTSSMTNKESALEMGKDRDIVVIWQDLVNLAYDVYSYY